MIIGFIVSFSTKNDDASQQKLRFLAVVQAPDLLNSDGVKPVFLLKSVTK